MSDVVETVTEIVKPIVLDHHFELVDVEFLKEGQSWFLRISIDKPGGIDIEECALISEIVSEEMDGMDPDPIPQNYFLEVSSPGAERPLKKEQDYENAVGEYINVSLYQSIDGKKMYEGFLDELSDEELTLRYRVKTREKTITIERSKIAKARLAIQF